MIVNIKSCIFLLFNFIFCYAYAQDINFDKFDKKIFKDKKEYRAIKKKIENADKLFNEAVISECVFNNKEELFLLSLKDYLEISQNFNHMSSALCRKIAFAYLFTNNKYKSDYYLNKSYSINEDQPGEYFFVLARTQQLNMYFDSAIDNYNLFLQSSFAKLDLFRNLVFKYIDECKNGKDLITNVPKAWVVNVNEINTSGNDLNPCITTDGEKMFYSSQGYLKDIDLVSLNYDYDIYSAKILNRQWSNITGLDEFNTVNDDLISNVSYDGQKILMFKDVGENNKNIFQSTLNGFNWTDPVPKMAANINSSLDETYSCYTPGDRVLYYIISNKKSDDIIFSVSDDIHDVSWRLGASVSDLINTNFNEGSVFVSADGRKMYFSSEGHNSMGGYDIFVSYLNENNQWSKPLNLGYPVNTPYDDLFFSSTASGKNAFISSNRKDSISKGNLDIYKVTFFGEPKKMLSSFEDKLISSLVQPLQEQHVPDQISVNSNNLTVFKGRIIDAVTNDPIEALIHIYNNTTGELMSRFNSNSETGKFLLSLPSGVNYGISVELEDYLFFSENFNLPNESEFNIVEKNIKMMKIAKGSKITLKNVFFDFDKHDIKKESYPELDRLVDLLLEFPNMKVELSGHTDDVGSERYNKKLSQKRSDEVRKYLISKGVIKGQLKSKGYGSERPIALNDTEDGRSKNRRTEFEILDN